jgi:hypothetical protein
MTEFKDALEFIEKYSRVIDMPDDRQLRAWNTGGMKAFVSNHFNEIQKALRIADRLMGEPSDAMIAHGQEYAYHEMKQHAEGCFRVMRDQLLKEIEQEGDK